MMDPATAEHMYLVVFLDGSSRRHMERYNTEDEALTRGAELWRHFSWVAFVYEASLTKVFLGDEEAPSTPAVS